MRGDERLRCDAHVPSTVMSTPGKQSRLVAKSPKGESSGKKRRRPDDDRFQMDAKHMDEDETEEKERLETHTMKVKKTKKTSKKASEVDQESEELAGDDDDGAIEEDSFDEAEDELDKETAAKEKAQSKQKAKRALLTLKAKEKQMRRGVVYLGAIPPRMKPQKLRLLLTPFGKLDRIYLTPEDPSLRLKRKKFGGNTVRIGPFPNPITVYCPYVTVYCLLHTSRVDCSARLLRLFAHTHCEVHPYSRL